MEFLVAGYEIIEQKPGLQGIYEACELPGRICYGSQDKIEPGSAAPFVERLMKSNHGAPLEHGTVYLIVPQEVVTKYMKNPYSKVTYSDINQYNQEYTDSFYWDDNYVELKYYVTTNLRVLIEND